ncbi:MAG: hypothetical protein ACYC36_00305 [Bellilinea sp.]
MQIKITIAGTYMNEELRAQKCQAGDLLETREWYAQQMAADGNGQLLTSAEDESAAKTKKDAVKAAAAAKKREARAAARAAAIAAKNAPPSNPFLG